MEKEETRNETRAERTICVEELQSSTDKLVKKSLDGGRTKSFAWRSCEPEMTNLIISKFVRYTQTAHASKRTIGREARVLFWFVGSEVTRPVKNAYSED